ncbi:unnamed protein product [Heligmosomoides polygyrus]|uniref:Doublecortin domain-containing protein n=1 Tax=Heligmosomoides polygyrus TaxID=6339 RepID=A0A183FDK3_HELPZ|nr:unnamed protein product [Heligmosomoides polygyrus]
MEPVKLMVLIETIYLYTIDRNRFYQDHQLNWFHAISAASSSRIRNGTLDPSYVMVSASDGGSLLRDPHRHRLIEFTKHLQDNVSVVVRGRSYEFRDLCEPYCDMNTAFLAFLKLYDPESPSTYTYPQVEIFGTQAFIGVTIERRKRRAPELLKRGSETDGCGLSSLEDNV